MIKCVNKSGSFVLQEAKRYADEDKKVQKKLDARNELEKLLYKARNEIGENGSGKLSYEEEEKLEQVLKK